MSITILCPTRGRPGAAIETRVSFEATQLLDGTRLVFVVDMNDPKLGEYEAVCPDFIAVPDSVGGNMVRALNHAAQVILDDPEDEPPEVLGFVGDDHRFRSHGFDAHVADDIGKLGGGFVYGDDLAQRENLPTQVFVSSSIVRALGWMAPPFLWHLYVDNAWLEMGRALHRITYDPRIVIEHIHPAYGKAEWDEGHVRVNSTETYGHDGTAFSAWRAGAFESDVARAKAAL